MPQERFYILSTKYSIQERMTKKHGRVYDVVFRVINQITLEEKQKKLSGYTTKTLARQAYTDFVTTQCELVKGNPVKKKNLEKTEPAFNDLVAEFIASLQNQNKTSSIYGKEKAFKKFIIPYFQNVKPTQISKEMLYRWQDNLWQTPNPRTGKFYSQKYLYSVRAFFQTFLAWCESRYGIKNNLKFVAKPKKRAPKTKMQIWTRKDFEKFIAVVNNSMYHAFFTILFFTGRRKGEVLALTKEDIKENSILFNKSLTRKTFNKESYEITSTKAEKEQATPICKTVQDELKMYKGESPFFFGGKKPIAENTLRRTFIRYCEIAQLNPIRIHDLRHSFVSMLIHMGANFMVIADLISDTVEQVIKTYGHLYESDKLEIIAKLN